MAFSAAPWARNGSLVRRLLPVLLLSALLAASAHAVPIGDLHCNDSNGKPLSPYTIGTTVSVAGTVTAGTGTFTSTYTDVWLEDATGGIEIYNAAVPITFTLGDSFQVGGTIDQYHGNTEIDMTTWTKVGANHVVPAPMVLTCWQAAHTFQTNNCEPNESRLVRLNNVTWSGSWAGNTSVTLTDSTGTCTMYIDSDTGVQNLLPPAGPFDLVAVLKQYDLTSPYTSDYEVLPRSGADIILHSGPQIVSGPVETGLEAHQVTITWTTDVPASSEVDYGLTSGYELGSVVDLTPVTSHALVVSGLSPATIYHYRVQSADQGDRTLTGDHSVLFRIGTGVQRAHHRVLQQERGRFPGQRISRVGQCRPGAEADRTDQRRPVLHRRLPVLV